MQSPPMQQLQRVHKRELFRGLVFPLWLRLLVLGPVLQLRHLYLL